MINEVNVYNPRYLAEVVRQASPVRAYFRNTFFTSVEPFSTEWMDIDPVKGDQCMAAFMHSRLGGKVLMTNGYITGSREPLLVNPYGVITVDRFMTHPSEEDLYSDVTPVQRTAQKPMREYATLNDATTRREGQMVVRAIMTGTIPIVNEGVDEVVDLNFISRITLSGGSKQGDTKADILSNLGDWIDKVLIGGFTNVGMVILDREAKKEFFTDANVQKIMNSHRMNMGEINPHDLPNSVRHSGHPTGPSLDLYTYGRMYYDDWTNPEEPATKPLTLDGAAILTSFHPNYMVTYGVCIYIKQAGGL